MANEWQKILDDFAGSRASSNPSANKSTSTKSTSTRNTSTTSTSKKKKKDDDWQSILDNFAGTRKTESSVAERVEERTTTGKEEEEEKKWYEGWFQKGASGESTSKAILGTLADVGEDLTTGLVGIGEKAVDAIASIAPYVYQGNLAANGVVTTPEQKKLHDDVVKEMKKENSEFIAKDLYDENKVAKQILSNVYGAANNAIKTQNGQQLTKDDIIQQKAQTQIAQQYLDNTMELDSVLGAKSDSLVQSGGQLLGTAALSAMGIPADVVIGLTSYGGEFENALNNGATYDEAALSSAVSAGAEILTEKISGGIKFGGKTLDDVGTQWLARNVSNKLGRTLLKMGMETAGEGFEEVLSGYASAIGQKLTYMSEKELNELFTKEDKWEAFIGGAALGSVGSATQTVNASVNGVDSVTGLTKNEQKVVDKVFKDELANAEKNGKVTEKQKSKIYDQVLNDFEKGYISTETIEEVLGDKDYQAYKETVDSEDALFKEFEELGKKQNATLAEQSRYSELQRQVADVKKYSTREALKNRLSESVYQKAQGDRLVESYNERARRGQAFEADLTKYDAKQQQTIQNAINSGTLNNTNRTHELVDFIAKVSADKGVLFDFTNNEKIKGTQFAVEGKIVNGYVTDSGITLNVESPKYLESTVGHEITHVLEGTEFYDTLKTTIFEYAKSKGEYDSRMADLTKMYENIEGADIEAELTADLVGDYLFQDADFVNKLSTENRNVFQKIYDEIKYLCKVATAGSKEARELEKVKRAFEKAYQEGSKTQSDTKYSVTEEYSDMIDSDGEVLTVAQKDYFEKSGLKDDNGNLLKLYRSADGGRTVWNGRGSGSDAEGIYLTDDFHIARAFASDGKKIGDVLEVYAKAENPLVIDAQGSNYMDIPMPDNAPEWLEDSGDWEGRLNADKLPITAFANGHDAVIIKNVREGVGGEPATDVILRESNQMKRTDNKNPSADPDIRYSLSDSDGKQLTKEQQEYFKDSKMRDENGNLKVMYHGSKNAGFHVFDSKFSDDDTSFFFVDRNEVAQSYSGTTEVYEARTIRTVEDMNNFLAEIGYDHYEAVEKNGKFELLENGDHVTTKDTVQEIYEEFCWYEGVGEGDANYKVYLNLKNPLEVDAQGRNWNRISTKFSQEVYDRYQRLTEEEKATLVDLAEWEDFSLFKGEIIDSIVQDKSGSLGKSVLKLADEYGDIDFHQLFDIAAEGFTEESLRENATEWLKTRDYAQKAKAEGYDGVIFKNIVDVGGYGNGDEGAATVAIAFDSNQIKSVANENPTADKDIRFSLSNVGDTAYGNRGTLGKDVAYVDPNAVAPIADNTDSNTERVTPDEMAEMFPDEPTPQTELNNLLQERETLESRMTEMGYSGDLTDFESVNNRWIEVSARIAELENEISESESGRVNSLGDADIPAEMEAPHFESNEVTVNNPFHDRDWREVGNQKVKAFMTENPEVKPFFQDAALGMVYDIDNGTKGERFYNDQLHYESGGEKGWMGVKRHTTDDIADLLDGYGWSYADIKKGLDGILEDKPNAFSKRLEFLLNDRLMNGYTDVEGRPIPPSQDYINLLNEMQINKDAREAFDSLMPVADQYAPEDVAPVVKTAPLAAATPDTMDAPIYQSKDPAAVKGQTTMLEPPKPNPSVATVLTEESQVAKEKSGFGMKVISQVVDKGAVFENYSHKTGNHEIQAKWNYALPSNTEARAQYFMEHGAEGVPALKKVMKTVNKSGKKDAFFNYMYHVHNIDRMTLDERFGLENMTVYGETVTADVSRRKVAKYEKANPEFKEWANDFYAINKHLRSLMSGKLVSQKTADWWEVKYPHYVPIRRVDSKGQNISVPLDTNKTGVNNPVKRATGGSSDIQPLDVTMAQRIEQVYRAIARNDFGIELKNTLGTTIDNQFDNMDVDELIDTIEAQEDKLLKPGTMNSNPTFTVFENGERVEFEITEDMYEALKPAGKILGHRIEALNKIGNFRRNLLTVWNPVFALYRNPIKDIQDVAVNSQHPVKTYLNVPNAIWQMATDGKWATEYHQNGGKSNTYFDSKTNEFKEDSIFKKTIGMPVRAVEAAGEFIEEIPRLAEYIASRQGGRSIERSMLDAARVTTNFAAGGDFTKFLNSHGFTFLNASVQGASQHVRNFREAKQQGLKGYVKVLAKYTAAGLPGVLLNSLMWDDDEEYEELSDYVKQNYYVVAKTQDGKFVRIPKGRTAAVMQNAFEQMEHLVTGDDEADFQTFFELFMNNIAPNNPIENNILAPIGQVMKNEAWYGGDLVPSRLQDLPAAEQFDESTDSISKWLGEKTNTSPYKWNYLLDQYSGGMGDVFLPMLTPEAESGDNSLMGNILAPWKKEITTDKVLNNKNPGDFYDLRDELEVKSNSRNATEEDAMQTMYMDSVSWDMSDLYKQKREVQNSDLPDDEKYEEVRKIQEQINELAKNALNSYNDIHIDGKYATVGDKRFDYSDYSGKWYEISGEYLEREQKAMERYGITPSDYWNDTDLYYKADWYFDDKYATVNREKVANMVFGGKRFAPYAAELGQIKGEDKDGDGKTDSGTKKDNIIDYINNSDLDFGERIITFKMSYPADDTYNMDIIDYLNSRDDIDYQGMKTILEELGFNVDSQGNITWD